MVKSSAKASIAKPSKPSVIKSSIKKKAKKCRTVDERG
jgi:hypothetical protein